MPIPVSKKWFSLEILFQYHYSFSENWQSPYEHRWSTLQHEFDQVHGMPHEDTQTSKSTFIWISIDSI